MHPKELTSLTDEQLDTYRDEVYQERKDTKGKDGGQMMRRIFLAEEFTRANREINSRTNKKTLDH